MEHNSPLLAGCRRVLAELYGDRLAGVVLFGSCARGEEDAESDVDLLVLLNGKFDLFEEMQRIIHALYPLQIEFGRCISAKPVSAERYRAGAVQLYRNAAREGVLI